MTAKTQKVLEFLFENYHQQVIDGIQIFNIRNIVGDRMIRVYEDEHVALDYCEDYDYFEIFGLTDEEFRDLDSALTTKEELL